MFCIPNSLYVAEVKKNGMWVCVKKYFVSPKAQVFLNDRENIGDS